MTQAATPTPRGTRSAYASKKDIPWRSITWASDLQHWEWHLPSLSCPETHRVKWDEWKRQGLLFVNHLCKNFHLRGNVFLVSVPPAPRQHLKNGNKSSMLDQCRHDQWPWRTITVKLNSQDWKKISQVLFPPMLHQPLPLSQHFLKEKICLWPSLLCKLSEKTHKRLFFSFVDFSPLCGRYCQHCRCKSERDIRAMPHTWEAKQIAELCFSCLWQSEQFTGGTLRQTSNLIDIWYLTFDNGYLTFTQHLLTSIALILFKRLRVTLVTSIV